MDEISNNKSIMDLYTSFIGIVQVIGIKIYIGKKVNLIKLNGL